MGKLHYGGAALATCCGVPLFVGALCLMVYGISLGGVALRSNGPHKGIAWAGVVLCASPPLVALGLIVARQIH